MNQQTQITELPVGAEGESVSASAELLPSKAGVEGHMTFFGPLQIHLLQQLGKMSKIFSRNT